MVNAGADASLPFAGASRLRSTILRNRGSIDGKAHLNSHLVEEAQYDRAVYGEHVEDDSEFAKTKSASVKMPAYTIDPKNRVKTAWDILQVRVRGSTRGCL